MSGPQSFVTVAGVPPSSAPHVAAPVAVRHVSASPPSFPVYGLHCHPNRIVKMNEDMDDGYYYLCYECKQQSRFYKNRNFGYDCESCMWGEL